MRAAGWIQAILILALAFPASADANPIRAQIGAPADGATFARGEPIAFIDATTTSESCPIVNWTWRFDDGSVGYGERVAYAYSEARDYRPSLHVVGSCGHRNGVTIALSVRNAPPRAALSAPANASAGVAFTLDASGSADPDGVVTEYYLTLDGAAFAPSATPRWTVELTRAGAHEASLVVVDQDGAQSDVARIAFDVAPAPLETITLTGPDRLQAAQLASYALDGRDAYGNRAPLSQETLLFRAPEVAGPVVVRHTEQGVTGARSVDVEPAALARIALDGPTQAAAGQTVRFGVRAFDAYGNARTPSQTSVEHEASTRTGNETVCHEEEGVQGCATLQVLAGPLAALAIAGPTEVAAGEDAAFALAGYDAYGNDVSLDERTLRWVAPTRAGLARVAYEERGVAATLDVLVVPDALALIEIDGPDEVAVGTSTEYSLRGSDRYGNDVALARATLGLDAPTTPGSVTIEHAEQGARAARRVAIVPGPLARLSLQGPAIVAAGETATFTLSGEDRYGNDVPLSNTSFAYAAPTATGEALACHTEDGVTACAAIEVVAGALAHIGIEGPTRLGAGDQALYTLHGSDRYANTVPLSTTSLIFAAPTSAGPVTLRHVEQDVVGELLVVIVAGELARIDVTGPTTLVAGTSATYDLAGQDRYGNEVPLSRSTIDITAPTKAGRTIVRYEEAGLEGALAIEVLAGPLAKLALGAPTEAIVGRDVVVAIAGYDAYGNEVALERPSFTWPAPTVAGEATISYTLDGISGVARILLVADALARIDVTGPAEVRAGDVAVFDASGADQHGNAVDLASPTFAWKAPDVVGPTEACVTESGVTGCAGVLVVPRVHRIAVGVSSAIASVNRPVLVAAAAYDDEDALVENVAFAWKVDGGAFSNGAVVTTRAGTIAVTASAYGVSGSATISVRARLLLRVELTEDTTLQASITRGLRGNVTVTYLDGAPGADATVTITVTRVGVGENAWPREQKKVATGADGRAEFAVSLPSGLLGDYRVDATTSLAGNIGSTTAMYTVAV